MRSLAGVLACLACCAALLGGVSAEEIPRAEHPRPDFRRDGWVSLNGSWQFGFDPKDRGVRARWWADSAALDRRIIVPFGWESPASKIADASGQRIGWYRRAARLPEDWRDQRVWLRFEGVRHEARVWVNGTPVGEHVGGEAPFEFDITELTQPGEEITVVVRVRGLGADPTPSAGRDAPAMSPPSGIWQTVWLEARPSRHVAGFRLTPKHMGSEWSLDVEVEVCGPDGRAVVELVSPRGAFPTRRGELTIQKGRGQQRLAVDVPSAKPWGPDEPHLYDLDIRCGGASPGGRQTDVVHTYFGLRTIERIEAGAAGRAAILLNGGLTFLRGALAASVSAEGHYTAPSDAFLRRDVEIARRLGLDFLRLPAGAEKSRKLYWADRLGVLILEEMPGGWPDTAEAREDWERSMRETLRRDRNHPAVIAWCLLGDSGGAEARKLADDKATREWIEGTWTEVKGQLDPSRLVVDRWSALTTHVKTDLPTWRLSVEDYAEARQRIERLIRAGGGESAKDSSADWPRQPGIVSAYGGVPPAGGDRDVSWTFRYLTTLLRQCDSIQGYVYDQLTDVRWEHNGLVNYDRTSKEFGYGAFVPGMTVADLQGADFVGYDAPPVLVLAPEESFTLPVFVSHYSARRESPRLRWQIAGVDDLGQAVSTEAQEVHATWRTGQVTFQKPLVASVPGRRPFVGALGLELLDAGGERIAANYVNLIVRLPPAATAADGPSGPRPQSPRVEVLESRLVALRFSPDDFKSFRSEEPTEHWFVPRSRVLGCGRCEVEYEIAIPEFVRRAVPTQIVLMAELATKSREERLDWPAVRHELDCPQTEHRTYPGKVAVRLAGKPLWRFDLPDDPADSRGVLSHEQRWQHGSFGYLVHQRADLSRQTAFRDTLRSASSVPLVFEAEETREDAAGKPEARGLSLFGERLGRYPIDPTLIVETALDLSHPPGWVSSTPVSVNRLLDRARRVTVLPTARQDGHPWRYTTAQPPPDWFAPEASAVSWATGRGGFGKPGTAALRVSTPWNGPEIWLRAEVELANVPRELVLQVYHQGAVEVYVNGKPLLERPGGAPGYEEVGLSGAQKALFRAGRNALAVHARQDAGEAGFDLGLESVVVDP